MSQTDILLILSKIAEEEPERYLTIPEIFGELEKHDKAIRLDKVYCQIDKLYMFGFLDVIIVDSKKLGTAYQRRAFKIKK